MRSLPFILYPLSFILFTLMGILSSGAADLPELHGFFEEAFGPRFESSDVKHRQCSMAEARLQLKANYYFDDDTILTDWQTAINAKSDFWLDLYFEGTVNTDLRELNLEFTPHDIVDVKIGRQVLTWGTGDYLFLNDLFPKDYESFFIGRDDEYLKKPSDALRLTVYPPWFNIDLALVPFFEPNIMPDGERLSFFDSFQGGIAGRRSDRMLIEPSRRAKNFTYAGRAYRNFGSYEAAGYYYRGFDPAPRSYKDEAARQLYYERLDSYGGSVRGPALGGIGNAEVAFYHSPEDEEGDIRTIQNSMLKWLVGYDKDMGNDLNVGLQYYVEETLNYIDYKKALLPADYQWAEFRHVITLRVTKLFARQTVRASIFSFFSPSDLDAYIRPSLVWNPTDAWTLTVGANLMWGRDSHTEFGSMQKNKNVYMRLRYSF